MGFDHPRQLLAGPSLRSALILALSLTVLPAQSRADLSALPIPADDWLDGNGGGVAVEPGGKGYGCFGDYTCYDVVITCNTVVRSARIRIHDQPSRIGAVWFNQGEAMDQFYAGANDVSDERFSSGQIDDAYDIGFRTLELDFTDPNPDRNGAHWTGVLEAAVGYRKAFCSWPHLVKWAVTNGIVEFGPTDAKFCAVGSSGGAALIAFGLATYGLENAIDAAVLISGPPISTIDVACLGGNSPYFNGAQAFVWDTACVSCPAEFACATHPDPPLCRANRAVESRPFGRHDFVMGYGAPAFYKCYANDDPPRNVLIGAQCGDGALLAAAVDFPGTNSYDFSLKGRKGGAATAEVELRVDGMLVHTFTLFSSSWQSTTTRTSVPAGLRPVSPTVSGNVFIEHLIV